MEREEDWEVGNAIGVLSIIKEKNPQVFLPIPEGIKLICYELWHKKVM